MVRETSGAASTVNEIIDMGIVGLGVLGTALTVWLFIMNRQIFMIVACLAILAYSVSMLFFVNNLMYKMQFAGDVMAYRIIKWATILVISLDLMLLVATVSDEWWRKKRADLAKGSRTNEPWQPKQPQQWQGPGQGQGQRRFSWDGQKYIPAKNGKYDAYGNLLTNSNGNGNGNGGGRGGRDGGRGGRGNGRGNGFGQQPRYGPQQDPPAPAN